MPFNWGNAAQGASAIGGIGALGGFIPSKDPSKEANKYLDQIPDQLKQYLMPYINAGMGALPNLQGISGEYEKMYKDPNEIISRLGSGYRESPGYRWKLNQGENAINNAAAMNGMIGTGQHQQQAGELAGNLADQDFQQYLGKILELFTGGLQGRAGIESGIFNTGAEAGGSLAANLAKILQAKAGLAYEGAANKNKQTSDIFSNIGSMGSKIGSAIGFGS